MDTKTASSLGTPPMASDTAPAATQAAQHAGMEAFKEITFGSMAGIVGKLVEYPFDTVKVRLQSQPDHLPLRYAGPLECFRQSIRHEGVRGLYRGVSAPVMGAAAENASLFWAYSLAQGLLRTTVVPTPDGDDLSLAWKVAAGAMSGGITSLILTPIELVKCRMQVPIHSHPSDSALHSGAGGLASATHSPFTVIRDVFRRQGLRGFWRGQLGTFLRETGGTAAWFGTYEATTLFFKQRLAMQHHTPVENVKSLPILQQMLSGAVAGVAYNFLFYPADTIKSKIQTGELTHVRPTFGSVCKELWLAHGLRGLYRGCGITVMRSAPSSALIFTIVENLKAAFD